MSDGWEGWDEYAPFYDWENLRTLGRQDLAFWRDLAGAEQAPVLELGCGTGRLLVPLARSGIAMTGLDRSDAMLARARTRLRRLPRAVRPRIIRGDIRSLPFPRRSFGMVLAPYGMLQSLLADRDLDDTLAEIARVLRRGGLLGIDLVPDLPAWAEYGRRVRMRGRSTSGTSITLTESVRQNRRKRLTMFDEEFSERRGRRVRRHRFTLTFRTRPVQEIADRLVRAGFRVDALLGDYRGRPWDPRAETWIVLARRR